MSEPRSVHSWKPVLVLSGLLVLFAGPIFGPVAAYAKEALGVRGGSGLVVALFVVVFGVLAAGTVRWVKEQGETLADLGWRVPTRTSAVVVAVLWGGLWAAFNVMGYVHQVDATADPMEMSLLRAGTAVGGLVIAFCEDLIGRGFMMNQLKKLGHGAWMQALFASFVFAFYHSVWTLSIAGFIMSFLVGLVFAGFFVWGRRSLTPVLVAHGLCLFLGEPFLTMFMLSAG